MASRSTSGTPAAQRTRKQNRPSLHLLPVERILVVVAALLLSLAFASSAAETLIVDGHTFEFLGVVYDEGGTSTWTYRVTSGRKPSLSHWVLELDEELDASIVVSASEVYEVNEDPKTDVYGLKFDEGYRDTESREVSFTLDAWYDVTDTRIAIKAGKRTAVDGTIPGPSPDEIEGGGNEPPVAVDDAVTVDENDYVNIDVTANDTDPDGSIDSTTVAIVGAPARGSIDVDPGTGVVTYVPDPNTCGSDQFAYTVHDFDDAGSNEATVTITIVCNESPLAGDDAASTDENTSIGINVLANDFDPDGTIDPSTVTIVSPPADGELTVHPTSGTVTYTPDPGACGVDTFRYTVDDDDGATSSEATVTIDVMCDDPPLAIDDLYSVAEGDTLTVRPAGILSNDVTSPWEPLTAILVADVSHGTLSLDVDGSFTYVHDGSETASDSFTYYATDGNDDSNVATVSLVITPTNDEPAAADDDARTDEDTPVDIDVLANDTDPDGDRLSVDWVSPASNGTVVNNGSDVTYTPDPDFHGTDTFTYGSTDGHGGSATATVTVIVDPINDPPIAEDDSAGTDEDTPVTIDVLPNDSDPDGDPLAILSVTQPANGASANQGDDVVYTPAPDFHGVDTFAYTVSDGEGGTSTATVTVTVDPVNDPPIAQDDSAGTDEDVPVAIDVLGNDTDPDGDGLSVESVTRPANGSVANNGADVVYTPGPDFHGIDTFTYTVSDGEGGTDTATVTVTVDPVNDPPVAQDDSAGTDEDVSVPIDVLGNDVDRDGDRLTVESVTQPTNGSVDSRGTDVVYTPDPGFNGTDAFTYTLSDGNGGTDIASVTVAIGAVNDPPVAQDDSAGTDEDVPVTIDVLGNDIDPDGDTLTVESVAQPANGSVANDGSDVVYTPDPDFHGVDTFVYTTSDGNGETDTATVTVTVDPVNDPPIAQDDSAGTDEDVPVTIDILGNDVDPEGDPLVVASVAQPANGSVTNNGSGVVYTPNPGYSGADTFDYTASDGNGGTDIATVTIAVALVNDLPLAVDDAVSTLEDTPVTIAVLPNDSDPDGDALSVESVTQPSHGTAVPSGTSVIYTPALGYAGTDTFTYTIADGRGGTDTASVAVTVEDVNDPPTAQDDSVTRPEDTPVTIAVLSNDADPDGDPLVVASLGAPASGTVTNNGTSVTYAPDPGFAGVDTFTYTVSDGRGGSDSARATIVVVAVNDPPVAQDDSATTGDGTLVSIPILDNDTDPDGDFLVVESFTQPSNGTVLNTRTGVSYIPDAGFQGTDAFAYTVSDGNGGTSTAAVTVSVDAVNAPPVANDDTAYTDEGTVTVTLVLLNDDDPDGDPLTVESVGNAENGTVTNLGSEIEYTPDPGFNGVDQFTYTVSDGQGGTATATVFVAVAGVNEAPTAQDDTEQTQQGEPVSIPVLANDTDPDGDPLFIESTSDPAGGVVTVSGGTIVYTPADGFIGPDTFTYTISDSQGETDTAEVTVGVLSGGAGGAAGAASCEGRVIINEIAWAGTSTDPRDEWIELRNLGTTPIDLTGWVLRWRRTRTSSDDQEWKTIALSGELAGAEISACDELATATTPEVSFQRESDAAWIVFGDPSRREAGYYTLERRSDATISNLGAGLIYDTKGLELELSDRGEVLMLIDPTGEVVDTANASRLGRDGWVAGSPTTFGTMERIDPLGPDISENWQTNLGIVIGGEDAGGRPLRATPGAANSPALEALATYEAIVPATLQIGETPRLSFALSRQDRKATGWPWIHVARPGLAGQGGPIDLSRFSFAGQHESGNQYTLEVGTTNLTPGSYVFWVIYAEGEALLLRINLTP